MRYALLPFLLCICCAASAAAEIASGEKTEVHKVDIKSLDIYTFYELLNKSEGMVVGEIGGSKDGTPVLNVKQTLKSPVNISPEKYKLAEELLKNQKAAQTSTAAKASTSTAASASTSTATG